MVITTVENRSQAQQLAQKVLQARLAACVQLESIESLYMWDAALQSDGEIRIVFKTKATLYTKLQNFIKRHHPYDVPQIVEVVIDGGSREYLDWISEETLSQEE
jgi:periplasmic divalent cation tolerance protein